MQRLKNIIKVKLKQIYGRIRIRKCGFWFIDIPRTSSSSIRVELANAYGSAYGKKDIIEKRYSSRQIFGVHIPANQMRAILGPSLWDKIYTFTFVRNPWDRMVSLYNYRRKCAYIPAHMTFRDYVLCLSNSDWGAEGGLFARHYYYFGCSDYVLEQNDEIIVSFIGKFENRSSDIAKIAARIGYDSLGKLAIQKASPPCKHYSEYYDRETKEIIKKLYAKDIHLFNYEFVNQKYEIKNLRQDF